MIRWLSIGLLALCSLPPATGQQVEWHEVRYGELLDTRQLSHSGETVGMLLQKLQGRPQPPPGERLEDQLTHSLLDPLVEPFAFVLQDVLDHLAPPPDRPMVEIGYLWHAGEAQPAWAELLRARRLLVESDGAGRMRACLPVVDLRQALDSTSASAARAAFEDAWPVLRHVFAAERARLAGAGEAPALDVEVFAYHHAREGALFLLGRDPFRTEVEDTRSRGGRPPIDLGELQAFLDSGLQLEGARLDADGRITLLGSRVTRRPGLLGRPFELSDFAVAFRAVFHGGLAEPYMSLDRGMSPQTSMVSYGGRLRDTALGMVSLLCDIRFKTFSLGLDIVSGNDERESLRKGIPDFRTHLERFAADRQSAGVLSQQTRLWFYPDIVDLTLSPELDVLAMRRVRMSAASERVEGGLGGKPAAEDPPWTRATVAAINERYDELAPFFPELDDLDQVVRLLSLFTWLREAERSGLVVPDLDALLSIELPPLYTPRTFPQLLTFNGLPPVGGEGPVAVYERTDVGQALDRLAPLGPRPLPARERFERARAALDPEDAQHARLLEELAALDPTQAADSTLDSQAYRAERLRMHRLVLSTLDRDRAAELTSRQSRGEKLRIFSVGTGGLDLGMQQVVDRSSSRSIGLGAETLVARNGSGGGDGSHAAERGSRAPRGPVDAWRSASPARPLPEHGLAPGKKQRSSGEERIDDRRPGGALEVLMNASSGEATLRRVFPRSDGTIDRVERFEGGRRLHYRFEREESRIQARLEAPRQVSVEERPDPLSAPPGLVQLALSAGGVTTPSLPVRLYAIQGGAVRRLEADFPRGVVQRLLLGRSVDLSSQPMPFSPLPDSLGVVDAVMALLEERQAVPPWDPRYAIVAGEEHAIRVARALNRWSRGTDVAQPAVVGVDAAASPQRWNLAPRIDGPGLLVLPPGDSSSPAFRRGWTGRVVERLPESFDEKLVILVSDEPPGLVAERLVSWAERAGMSGKLLAAWATAGELRPDLPVRLLASGRLAGVGVAETTIPGLRRAVADLDAFGRELASPRQSGARIESVAGPFLWFY